MEPLLMVFVPGVLGGIVLAFFIARIRVHGLPQRERPLDAPNPGHINMASIRIQGVGGLGIVAMAIAVAIGEPRIRAAMALALVLSLPLAVALIMRRRRTGPFPSGNEPGAHSMLPNDPTDARRASRDRAPRGGTNRRAVVASLR
jgi:drug/metabolite transporter (DMT)-like permease